MARRPGDRRFLVRVLPMCGEAFSIKTELTTVPTRGDIGEAAADDAEGVRSLTVVAAVQMLDITGGVHIGELVATVRGRTLETDPGAGSGGGGSERIGGLREGSGAGGGACA